ncbi:MAG: hypothetical protein PHE21_02390 [Candidatus Dojkabacteria bacterium]|nr:hypothetical protein [Candidatus Dojkabacteria bacterium]
MENINNIEQNPVNNIETSGSEGRSFMGEVDIPQNPPPIEVKTLETGKSDITKVKSSNELNQSLGYPVTENNKSLGSGIVREKMNGDTKNL